jgi:hypothetical protein
MAKPLDHAPELAKVNHHLALGQLDDDLRGRHGCRAHFFVQPAQRVGQQEYVERNVQGDGAAKPCQFERRQIGEAPLGDQAGQFGSETGVLDPRHEMVGPQQTVTDTIEPREGLEPGRPAIGQAHQWLIACVDTPVCQSCSQCRQ